MNRFVPHKYMQVSVNIKKIKFYSCNTSMCASRKNFVYLLLLFSPCIFLFFYPCCLYRNTTIKPLTCKQVGWPYKKSTSHFGNDNNNNNKVCVEISRDQLSFTFIARRCLTAYITLPFMLFANRIVFDLNNCLHTYAYIHTHTCDFLLAGFKLDQL